MRVAVLATGGKDSTLALYRAMKSGHTVETLVCMIPQREDSYMFHYPNIRLIDLYAEAVELPLVKGETSGEKERETEDLRRVLEGLNVEGVVSGAVASNYQRARIEAICRQLSLECLTPLWHEDPYELLWEMLRLNFEAIIVGVYALGFSPDWLGRRIDEATLKDLAVLSRRYGVSLVGEGGEYETLVLDAQFFKKRIRVHEAEKLWDGQRGIYQIRRATLQNK